MQKYLWDNISNKASGLMLPNFKTPELETLEKPEVLNPSLVADLDEDMHRIYKMAEKAFWVFDELKVELAKDARDWKKLSEDQQHFIKHILAFFAVSDFYVNETITEQLKTRIKYLPWHRWEDFKMAIENTHNITYGRLVETYVTDSAERKQILEAVRYNPAIQQKIDWMHKWVGKSNQMVHLEESKQHAIRDLYNFYVGEKARALQGVGLIDSSKISDAEITDILKQYLPANILELGEELAEAKPSLALVVLINAIVEGVFFSGSFCAIFWLKKMGFLPGLSAANDLISRDEGLHCMFAIMIYRYKLQYKLSEDLVHEIFREAVAIEQDFICNALPNDMMGMNSRLMGRYIEFVADQQLFFLGYNRIWTVDERDNPFPWMEDQSIGVRMTDFFKKTPNAYGHHAAALTVEELRPAFDEDF